MTNENTNTLTLIEKELEEKSANFQGLATKIAEAKKFIHDNESNLLALDGAVQQLRILKEKLSSPKEEKPSPEETSKVVE